MRVGFIGASGTGKSTLVRFLQSAYPDVPVNPVGSRSVAKAMGFVHPEGGPQAGEGNPYAVDGALARTYTRLLDRGEDPVQAAGCAVDEWNQAWGRHAAAERGPKGSSCRSLFQVRLQVEKIAWEADHDAFFTDRTSLDDLAYAILHCREVVDGAFMDRAFAAMARYDAVFYCPLATFCNLDGDPSRVKDPAYHRVHDAILAGLIEQHKIAGGRHICVLWDPDLTERWNLVSEFVPEFAP